MFVFWHWKFSIALLAAGYAMWWRLCRRLLVGIKRSDASKGTALFLWWGVNIHLSHGGLYKESDLADGVMVFGGTRCTIDSYSSSVQTTRKANRERSPRYTSSHRATSSSDFSRPVSRQTRFLYSGFAHIPSFLHATSCALPGWQRLAQPQMAAY